MPDIDTIRREIDGLHGKADATPWAFLNELGHIRTERFVLCMEVDLHEGDLIVALVNNWPTISRALAEAEADRRKARAFDEIKEHIEHIGGDYRIRATFCYPHEGHEAIEAALAAKETT